MEQAERIVIGRLAYQSTRQLTPARHGLQPPTNSLCCSTHYCLSWLSKDGEIELLCIQGRGRVSRCFLYMYISSIYLRCVSCSSTSPSSRLKPSKPPLYELCTSEYLGLGQHGYGCPVVASLATLPSPHFRSYQHQWASDSTMPCHEPRPKGLSLHHSLVQGPRILICLCYLFFSFSFSAGLFFRVPSPEAQDKASTPRESPVVAADRGLRHQRHDAVKCPRYP